jgi:23S rRNA pseudouridine1911/1915/1917 synthase
MNSTKVLKSMEEFVLYEDNHLIVVNKQAGEITQGDKTGDIPLPEKVKQYIKVKDQKPGNVFLGVVHRLDRPTSGIVVFAKTSKALARMNKLFQEKKVQKTYWAIVEKAPEKKEDTLIHFLQKNEKQNKSYVRNNEANNTIKKATLEYRLTHSSDKYHLLEVLPNTGRHHQIRVQLSYIGCVIKGDVKYGARRPNKDNSICLHARKIELIHPVSQSKISITAPVPKESLWEYFQSKQ